MDVFERVREVSAGAGLTAEQISLARSGLLEGIDAHGAVVRRRASRRPLYLIAGGVVGVAAITTAVLVVNQHAAPAPRVEAVPAPTASPVPTVPTTPEPTPSPGTGAGAGVVEPYPGTTPQAGQFLKLSTKAQTLLYRGPEGTAYQWGYRLPASAAPYSAIVVQDDSALFVPADRASDWVRVSGPRSTHLRAYPEPQSAEDAAAWDSLIPVREGSLSRAAGGAFTGQTAVIDFADYPTDAGALLDRIRHQYADAGPDQDERTVASIIGVLRSNLAPAPLRKAFLQALERTGLSTVASVDGSLTTYAVDFTTTGVRRETVTIDARTGWATEYTVTVHREDGGLVPADVPDVRFILSQAIVDAAP